MRNRSRQIRAGIYTRISWDPDGQRAGVERQRLDCEALCRSRGWEIARYLEDYAHVRVTALSSRLGCRPSSRGGRRARSAPQRQGDGGEAR